MIHAYQEIYLSNAQASLGEALDFAVNVCGFKGEDFVKLFSVSSVCKKLESGEPKWIAGKSGPEIVDSVLLETTGNGVDAKPITSFERSREYWIGWAVAYYQWYSTWSYYDIFTALRYETLEFLYPTLHEADISKFVEVAGRRMSETFPDTNLKRMRMYYGCSQSDLSRKSGVKLRSIQMYEQRNKDINKASVETVQRLAMVLGCKIEDLMEKHEVSL